MYRKPRHDGLLMVALALVVVSAAAPRTSATLVVSSPQLTYPQVSAGVNGGVNYDYAPSSGLGFFHMENQPYVLALGGSLSDKFTVTPSVGFQMQTLDLTLNSQGQLAADGFSMYNLMGTLTAGGQTYSGVLLNGEVTAFGYQDLTAFGIYGTTFYDAMIHITGGSLAGLFGPTAYLYFHVDTGSTFTGRFDQHFQGEIPYGTIMPATTVMTPAAMILGAGAALDPADSVVPEPSTGLLFAFGAAVLAGAWRRRAV